MHKGTDKVIFAVMGIYKKVGNEWKLFKYISDNGEDAVKCGYSRASHDENRKYFKEEFWKDKSGVQHQVKLQEAT